MQLNPIKAAIRAESKVLAKLYPVTLVQTLVILPVVQLRILAKMDYLLT